MSHRQKYWQTSNDTKVTWSRVRYRGYGITAIEVTPKAKDISARMRIRALDEDGLLIDEITLQRPQCGGSGVPSARPGRRSVSS